MSVSFKVAVRTEAELSTRGVSATTVSSSVTPEGCKVKFTGMFEPTVTRTSVRFTVWKPAMLALTV